MEARTGDQRHRGEHLGQHHPRCGGGVRHGPRRSRRRPAHADRTGLFPASLCDLPEATAHVMKQLETQAALTSDVTLLMESLLPLAQIARYGNVRKTDSEMVLQVIDGMVTRTCIGLPGACASLDDAAAARDVQADHEHRRGAGAASECRASDPLAGYAASPCSSARICMGCWQGASRAFCSMPDASTPRKARAGCGFRWRAPRDPPQAAAWVEGFLSGSGSILIHDDKLWSVIDDWVTTLAARSYLRRCCRCCAGHSPPSTPSSAAKSAARPAGARSACCTQRRLRRFRCGACRGGSAARCAAIGTQSRVREDMNDRQIALQLT